MKKLKLKQKVKFPIQVSETETIEILGTIIEIMNDNKYKVEYSRPEGGWKGIKIIELTNGFQL